MTTRPSARSRQARRACIWAAVFLAVSAVPAIAGYTEVHVPHVGEASHEEILEGIYGGDFVVGGVDLGNGLWTVFDNGTITATRMDDYGLATLLYILTGSPGSGDDDTWADGTAIVTAEARFALFPQEFGYDSGSGFVKLVDVLGSGFSVSGSGTVTFAPRVTWQWARANDSDAGLVNDHYSEETFNDDGLDHMVTYHVAGVPEVLPTSMVWLVFWEDLNGPLGDDSDPDNAGSPSDRDFNDLVMEILVQECFVDEDCDDGDACTIDMCNEYGICEYAPAPEGTACGDPKPEEICDNPDVCDGAGNCLPNYEPPTT
ncbi:MAG: hypothetical protein WBE26_17880, partial [Phycisphaerae bacterium]